MFDMIFLLFFYYLFIIFAEVYPHANSVMVFVIQAMNIGPVVFYTRFTRRNNAGHGIVKLNIQKVYFKSYKNI